MPYSLPISPTPPPIVQVERDRSSNPNLSTPEPKLPPNQEVTLNPADSSLPARLKASTRSTPVAVTLNPADSSLPARLKASTKAAPLGTPLSVGYSVQGSTTAAENSPLPTSISSQTTPLEFVAQTPTTPANDILSPTEGVKTPVENEPIEAQFTPPATNLETQTPPVATPVKPQPTPPATPPNPSAPSNVAPVSSRIVELNADRQEFDQQRQIVTAEGNVILRLNGGVIDADSLQVNLSNRIAVGQGDVALTRGEQVLRGERFTYNFVQNTGELLNASGEIFIPSASQDLSVNLATDVSAGGVPANPPSDRITANQPRQNVTSNGGIGVSVGAGRDINNLALPQKGGVVRRLRFQAQQVQFYPQGWQAQNVKITNDPFSPAELELRADKVTLTRETPQRDRIRTTRQRLVFDQGLSIPIPKDETVIDRSERDVTPGLFQIGVDGDERGGVFIERNFSPINNETVQLTITPQFFAQQAVLENGGNVLDPDVYGLRSKLKVNLGERTKIRGRASITSLDLSQIEDNLRASLRLSQSIGKVEAPHQLTLEYSYRDRLFNGSLGYQTVQSSLGGVLTSPVIALGTTGIALSYQAGAQLITSDSDRADLLAVNRDNDRISLSRLQASVALNRGFALWQGQALAATPTAGLRYTPTPIVPYVSLFTGLKGVSSLYSSGDTQNTITGTIGIQGQLGHLSRRFFDYTAFNVSFSQDIRSGLSPFLFDRAVDSKVLDIGFAQQVYGPFRFGIQASINLDTGENISTDYILEYSRRTYGITLRYNPVLALGSLSFRISDFNWSGGSNSFSDSEVRPVLNGVRQINE
jgi:lipopolysaccharide export system protein LptA